MDLPDFLTQDEYGDIRVTGRRIGLYTLVRDYKEGKSAEELAAEYELVPDLVRKVIAFYLDNRDEVDAYVEAYRAELERQEAAHQPGPGILKLRRQMALIRQADEKHAGNPE